MFDRSFIDSIVSRTDIAQEISAVVELRKSGSYLSGLCPFHSEKSASFMVNEKRQSYKCHGCGASGDVISFVSDYFKFEFLESINYLAKKLGIEVPRYQPTAKASSTSAYDVNARFLDCFQLNLQKPEPYVSQYIEGRKITSEMISEFALGFATGSEYPAVFNDLKGAEPVARELKLVVENGERCLRSFFFNRLMFPIRDTLGRVISFGGRVLGDAKPKYLNGVETQVFRKANQLYGLYECTRRAVKFPRVFIVEGYLDVIRLVTNNVFAVAPMGTSLSDKQILKLSRYTDQIVFCFDGDQAGWKAAKRALVTVFGQSSLLNSVRLLLLPAGHDPDSYVCEFGVSQFNDFADSQSLSFEDFFVKACFAEGDLGSAGGKTRIIAEGRSLLRGFEASPIYSLLMSKLQSIVGVSGVRTLYGTLAKKGAKKAPLQNKLTIMRVAAVAILRHPKRFLAFKDISVYRSLAESFGDIGFLFLCELLDVVREKGEDIDLELLLNQLTPQSRTTSLKLLALPVLTEEADVLDIVDRAVKQSLRSYHRKYIGELKLKASSGSLSTEERQEMLMIARAQHSAG